MDQDFKQLIEGLGLRHFKPEELLVATGKKRGSVSNSLPRQELWHNIIPTIIVLDELRHQLRAPISLISVYRDPDYNHAVGGASRSQHMDFRGIDFACNTGKPDHWANLLKAMRGHSFNLGCIRPIGKHAPFNPAGLDIQSRFVFAGGIGVYPTFVHIDTRGENADF